MTEATRFPSRTGKFFTDLLLWTAATPLAFFTRYDWFTPLDLYPTIWSLTFVLAIFKAAVIGYFGLHRQTWRRIAFRDLFSVLGAIGAVMLMTASTLFLAGTSFGIPRSVPLLEAFYAAVMMTAARAILRLWYERRLWNRVSAVDRKRVLIVGAGEAGTMIVREMLRHPETGLSPIAFADDDPRKHGQRISGVPVLGSISDLESLVARHEIEEVLIAIPSADGQVVRSVIERTGKAKRAVQYRTIPGIYELLGGRVTIDRIREVEVEDLLGRAPVNLDVATISKYIEGRTILVSGAGGSIGSELVRQICRFHPRRMVLLGRGENSLYQLERELDRDWPDSPYRTIVCDVRDKTRLSQVFEAHNPGVVFHAAAHKHVPLMELNPEEAVTNNVLGTRNIAELCLSHRVERLVNISTDKAVNPTSVMGGSKRMAEFFVQDAACDALSTQRFVSVRFGNVLGSRGSVIPLFKQQIRAGGPVTVTHPEMRRFFMTIPEAAQLVLQAGAIGANGDTYILDMGEAVRISDLASDLIRLSGFEPHVDIRIEFSGTRPGEKLYEELMTESERQAGTSHDKIFVARSKAIDRQVLRDAMEELLYAARHGDGMKIRTILDHVIEDGSIWRTGDGGMTDSLRRRTT